MVTPDTQSVETVPATADTEAAPGGATARKLLDDEVAALTRISVPFVFVACLGLLVAFVGLLIDRFYVSLAGTGLVATGAMAWVVAASTVIWKMARELFNGRRIAASRISFAGSDKETETG